MNKKGLSTIIALLIMILLTLIAVGIIWVVVRNVILTEFPQYKITKEVCGNQEILIPDNLTLIGYTEEPFVSEFEINISNTDFKVKYKFIGQVCETQEVPFSFNFKDCMDYCYKIRNEDRDCILSCYDSAMPNFKEGLTQEWLEENCECFYGCAKVDNTCLESCEIKCPTCDKWTCGEYQVEVLI
jgi:hypothetical protein